MNGIHIIPFDNITHHIHHEFLRFFISGIEVFFITIGQEPFRVDADNMIGGNGGGAEVMDSAVRIEPGMEFHAAFMRLFDHELHRIPEWDWWFSLCSGEPFAPGLKGRGVEGIGGGTYLYDHRVHAIALVQFEQTDIFSFLFFRGAITTLWPVDIVDRSDPHAPEFIFGLCGDRKCSEKGQGK